MAPVLCSIVWCALELLNKIRRIVNQALGSVLIIVVYRPHTCHGSQLCVPAGNAAVKIRVTGFLFLHFPVPCITRLLLAAVHIRLVLPLE
jgi:hypothetical protein